MFDDDDSYEKDLSMYSYQEIHGYTEGFGLHLIYVGPPGRICIRRHTSIEQDPAKPRGRTLYLLDIRPYFAHKALIKNFYTKAVGPVQSIKFTNSATYPDYKNVNIVFTTNASLVKSLQSPLMDLVGMMYDSTISDQDKDISNYFETVRWKEELRQERLGKPKVLFKKTKSRLRKRMSHPYVTHRYNLRARNVKETAKGRKSKP